MKNYEGTLCKYPYDRVYFSSSKFVDVNKPCSLPDTSDSESSIWKEESKSSMEEYKDEETIEMNWEGELIYYLPELIKEMKKMRSLGINRWSMKKKKNQIMLLWKCNSKEHYKHNTSW